MNNNDNTEGQRCPFPHATPAVANIHIPDRIKKLPVMRGFAVPYFVGHHPETRERDFRIADTGKLRDCIINKRCWVCGEGMGRNKSFVTGPMCCMTRTSAEPPSHHECAVYSAQACPFLTRPNMKRRQHEEIKGMANESTPGEMIERNPGVCAVWTTTGYELFRDGRGGTLIRMGDPEKVEWFAMGRPATRAEVIESIHTGIPILRGMCDKEETAEDRAASHRQLDAMRAELEGWLPES